MQKKVKFRFYFDLTNRGIFWAVNIGMWAFGLYYLIFDDVVYALGFGLFLAFVYCLIVGWKLEKDLLESSDAVVSNDRSSKFTSSFGVHLVVRFTDGRIWEKDLLGENKEILEEKFKSIVGEPFSFMVRDQNSFVVINGQDISCVSVSRIFKEETLNSKF